LALAAAVLGSFVVEATIFVPSSAARALIAS
jgi:hypothetical protein